MDIWILLVPIFHALAASTGSNRSMTTQTQQKVVEKEADFEFDVASKADPRTSDSLSDRWLTRRPQKSKSGTNDTQHDP